MTTTVELLEAVNSDLFRDYTNESGVPSSPNSTRLAALATAAEGMFLREVGIAADADIALHQGPLIACAIYYAEAWKRRDSRMIEQARQEAVDECMAIRSKLTVAPQTSSPLTATVPERSGDEPDMSKVSLRPMLIGERRARINREEIS